jgi:hypothetical protein
MTVYEFKRWTKNKKTITVFEKGIFLDNCISKKKG